MLFVGRLSTSGLGRSRVVFEINVPSFDEIDGRIMPSFSNASQGLDETLRDSCRSEARLISEASPDLSAPIHPRPDERVIVSMRTCVCRSTSGAGARMSGARAKFELCDGFDVSGPQVASRVRQPL